MLSRAYYHSSVREFLECGTDSILGQLTKNHGHALDHLQRDAWIAQIDCLREALANWPHGYLLVEFAIPRMGKRADAVLLLGSTVFVIEFKVGANGYDRYAKDQVLDYALDLKNFHEGSHERPIVPILVATKAPGVDSPVQWESDEVASPILANHINLRDAIGRIQTTAHTPIDPGQWLASRYKPTPTIIEAARALYMGHRVQDISRSDAGAINLSQTAEAIAAAIEQAKSTRQKTICLVTGVPGSGKTLAGLNLATQRMRAEEDEHAVFLSGNGPLVAVLREALTRDEVQRAKEEGRKLTKKAAATKANAFIQNIHHFRDESLRTTHAPIEKVVVFDEAQRAWTKKQAADFMRTKRQVPDFDMSEPEFLLSVMDRHEDWCVVVCLIGGGQEINTGEAGLSEWFAALGQRFSHWRVLCSDRLLESSYPEGRGLAVALDQVGAEIESALHLGVNVRSFRAEKVSAFVGAVIDGDAETAARQMQEISKYPIVLTRDLDRARRWLKDQARGTERYGLVASSNALRLKPAGLHVKAKIDPENWFLNDNGDVRSSFALEDIATEFDIQGLELDWVGVCWDANLRRAEDRWSFHRFSGAAWKSVKDPSRQMYLANAYRVLLTRARQGMVIYVPRGDADDSTRAPVFYDGVFDYLRMCGVPMLESW